MRTLYMLALAIGVTTALRAPSPICMAKAKAGKKKAVKPKVAARGFGAAPTAAPAKSAADPEWSAFINWLDKSGATTDAVALASFGGLRGVRVTRPIKAGEELIRIPRAAILDGVAADESAVAGLWRDSATPPPGYAKLALAILYELRLGSASRYAPYLNLLPSMEAFASGGGPAATWSDEELAVTECGKLIAQASSLRELRRNGGGHAALEPSKLQARWIELNLPGSPPNEEELAWAVTAVTSRAYTVEEGGSEGGSTDGSTVSGMIPMVCARTKRPLTHNL